MSVSTATKLEKQDGVIDIIMWVQDKQVAPRHTLSVDRKREMYADFAEDTDLDVKDRIKAIEADTKLVGDGAAKQVEITGSVQHTLETMSDAELSEELKKIGCHDDLNFIDTHCVQLPDVSTVALTPTVVDAEEVEEVEAEPVAPDDLSYLEYDFNPNDYEWDDESDDEQEPADVDAFEKKCTKCKNVLGIWSFSKNHLAPGGYSARCKECVKEYRNSDKGVEAYRRARAKEREDHPRERAARSAVYNATKSGKLVRPEVCSECGVTPDKIYGHHWSYEVENQLDVVWCCNGCHRKIHDTL
tara:strand:- start:331 stop:1233 length:903 start_codon:yes stop_codon:yes gene_type:complete